MTGLAGNIPVTLGVSLVEIYTASRVGHTVVYLLGSEKLNSSVRAVAWMGGVVVTLTMAAMSFGFNKSK